MKAIVMAGGFGSRLYPLTVSSPKPMVPLVNKPMLAHILNLLKHHGFSDVILTVQYKADQIQDYFGDGRQFGLSIHYAVEETPLGTAGGVKNTEPFLDDEPFLVISGDIVTDINLRSALHFHHRKRALATLILKQIANPEGYGVVAQGPGGRITGYEEKPSGNYSLPCLVNTGIYIFEPDILSMMDCGGTYDFSYDIFPALLSRDAPLFGYATNKYWCDLGTIPRYQQATADVLAGKVDLIDLGRQLSHGVWMGRDVQVEPGVTLQGPVYLGHEVKVKRGAQIQGPAVIYDQAVIDHNAVVEQAIVGQNSFIGHSFHLKNKVIPQKTTLPTKLIDYRQAQSVTAVSAGK